MKSNQATLGIRSDGWSKKSNEFEICLKWKFSAVGGALWCTERIWLHRKRSTGRENKYSQQYPQRSPTSCVCRVQEGLELHSVSGQSSCEKLEAHFAV